MPQDRTRAYDHIKCFEFSTYCHELTLLIIKKWGKKDKYLLTVTQPQTLTSATKRQKGYFSIIIPIYTNNCQYCSECLNYIIAVAQASKRR